MTHIESIEACLRLAQRRFHLTGLQHLRRMIRRNAQGLSAIDDILTQSEGETGNTLFGRFVTDGIIVQRAQHAREVGIIEITILFAHHLLQNDSHLLLVDDILRGQHISLRILVIDRGIDTLNGTGQHTQHLVFVVEIRNHIGAVDTSKRLVVGIFKQR